MDRSGFASIINLIVSSVEPCIADVAHDSLVEERRVLWHDTNIFSETFKRDMPDILTVNLDGALPDIIESEEELQNCRFATTRFPN
jgi:hypothetical protein